MNQSRIFLIAIKRQFRLSNIITFGVLALLFILTNVLMSSAPEFQRLIRSSIYTTFISVLIVRLIFVLKETNNHDMNKAIYLNYNAKSVYIARILSDFLLVFFGLLLVTGSPIAIHAIKNGMPVSFDDISKWLLLILGYSAIYAFITVMFRFIQSSIKIKGLRALAYTFTILMTYVFMILMNILMNRNLTWAFDLQQWIYENKEAVTWTPILNIMTINLIFENYEFWRIVPFIVYSMGIVSLIAILGATKRKTLLCA